MMITRFQEKLIRSLHTKKGREEAGLCLVEGRKVVETAGSAVEWTFTETDTSDFSKLVTTETPQAIAGVARIPQWTREDIISKQTIVVLDGVQDPGNVGGILRLCLGFDAALLLVESADVTNPKVVRSSVGALFHVPWMTASPQRAAELIESFHRPIFRLEKTQPGNGTSGGESVTMHEMNALFEPNQHRVVIAGSEGRGIRLPITGTSLCIQQDPQLESLNVGHALAIVLHAVYSHARNTPGEFRGVNTAG